MRAYIWYLLIMVLLVGLLISSKAQEEGSRTKQSIISLHYTEAAPDTGTFITLNPSQIIAQRKLAQQLFVYSKNAQTSEVYLGQLVDAQMVEIGPIGDVSYVKELTVSNEQLFGRPVVLVSGFCGAMCAVNDVLVEKDGRLQLYLSFNQSIDLVDLNGDGSKELLTMEASPGISMDVYRMKEDRIEHTNLNEAVGGAQSVDYDKANGWFEAGWTPERIERYRYSPDGNALLPEGR